MTKRQEAALVTRNKILRAAKKLIDEKGFEAVNVSDITEEAGVAKGSFYTYFKRKEDICTELALMRFSELEESAKSAEDVESRITDFVIQSAQFIYESGLHVCQQWVRNVAETGNSDGAKKLEYDIGAVKKALDDAVISGELKPDTPTDRLAGAISSAYYGAVFIWAVTDGEIDLRDGAARVTGEVLSDIIARWKA